VTIKVGSLNIEINKPLIAPSNIPTEHEIRNAKNILSTPEAIRTFADMYCPAIAIAVKDTSIPPDNRIIKNPMAKMPIPALLFIRSNKFSRVRKEGLIEAIIVEKTIIIKNKYISLCLNIFLIFAFIIVYNY